MGRRSVGTKSGNPEEALGRCLFEAMERLDPSDEREWVDLTDREREFFCLCAKAVTVRAASLGRGNRG
jgi:hypothetical protein